MHVAWDKTRNLLPRGEERWQMVVVRGRKHYGTAGFCCTEMEHPGTFHLYGGGLAQEMVFCVGRILQVLGG